ncbi:hypothetical protein IJE86_07535 [bacterium]|nr:hypothetical protein [bacterium]
MQINKLPSYQSIPLLNRNSTQPKTSSPQQYKQISELGAFPKSYIVSFSGGKSLNLSDTMQAIEEHENRQGKQLISEELREKADEILENGNPKNLKLKDVHAMVYGDISALDTVEEIREFYTEFESIKSIDETKTRKDSFLSKVKNGEYAYIDPNKDITVQFMNLYWAKGLSLNDIVKYINSGENKGEDICTSSIDQCLSSLGIPVREKTVAHYLKLSDEEANKIITGLISQYHKTHPHIHLNQTQQREEISHKQYQKKLDRAKQYSIEHPDNIEKMSSAQKAYFAEHPEILLGLKIATSWAWNMGSCKEIRNDFSRFSESYLANPNNQTKEAKNGAMKAFWATHPKHKETWAKAINRTWEKLKDDYSQENLKFLATTKFLPESMEENIKQYAKTKGYKRTNQLDFNLGIYAKKQCSHSFKEGKLLNEYFNDPANKADASLLYTIIEMVRQAKANFKMKKNIPDNIMYDVADFYNDIAKISKNSPQIAEKLLSHMNNIANEMIKSAKANEAKAETRMRMIKGIQEFNTILGEYSTLQNGEIQRIEKLVEGVHRHNLESKLNSLNTNNISPNSRSKTLIGITI